MTTSSSIVPAPTSRLYIVTLGFAVAVGMWLTGYVCHLPGLTVPRPVTLAGMLAWLPAGGVLAGRLAGAGAGGGALVGLVSALVNLLILGSVVAVGDSPNAVVPSMLLWVPGSLVLSCALAAVGAAVTPARGAALDRDAWRTGFALVASVATLLVVIAGGLVTSMEVGLAVPDWPNSFGWNMFLYPLAKMTADTGIYYEHAHRLYGSLVGLTTIVLAVVLWSDERPWIRKLVVLLVVMVIVQGVLGGTRVIATNLATAIVHGVFGQVFLVAVALTWAVTARSWRDARAAPAESASTDHTMTGLLVFVILLQLVSGALYRHLYTEEVPMPWPAHLHLTLAALVACLGFVVGLRAWAKHPDQPMLRRFGAAMLGLLGLQLLLGISALIAVLARRDGPYVAEVAITTAHQANGAIVLVVSAQLAVWARRGLVAQPGATEAVEATA
jgi:cytochrome c oxidase assembly protein subunit 15